MNRAHLLLLAMCLATAADAQDTPVPKALPADEPAAPTTLPELPPPVEVVKAAIPVKSEPVAKPPIFTEEQVQDKIRQIETPLKKKMMLVGMGSGVAGLLLGMMIGRATAPRSTSRRY